MSAAKRVAAAAGVIRAAWERGVAGDPQTTAAQALDDAGLLMSPEIAAELAELRERVAELESAQTQIRDLHKDSPMGPCPLCIDEDAMVRGDDYTVPYPCPTARLAGAKDFDPPSSRGVLPARDALCVCGHGGVDHHHADTKCWAHRPKRIGGPVTICPCSAFGAAHPHPAPCRWPSYPHCTCHPANPSACGQCGVPERQHAQQWEPSAGWHTWVAPSQAQILARMRARRAARTGGAS
ncbi:hypothetical protein [Streptomyces uncialis]|uniref:hypothetical protein n=1 Tax=Streptomyces uncialis TaxID=1048205 RepID=UPI0033C6AEE1